MVILEFPDRKHAEDWLKDPDYEAASKYRRAASTSRLIVQEGRGNTEDPDPMI